VVEKNTVDALKRIEKWKNAGQLTGILILSRQLTSQRTVANRLVRWN
jgi:hypothetical protein